MLDWHRHFFCILSLNPLAAANSNRMPSAVRGTVFVRQSLNRFIEFKGREICNTTSVKFLYIHVPRQIYRIIVRVRHRFYVEKGNQPTNSGIIFNISEIVLFM